MNVRRASAVDDVLGVDTLPDEAEIAALRYGGGGRRSRGCFAPPQRRGRWSRS